MNKEIDLTNVVLETERLILREWNENDLEDLYANASIPEFGEIAGWKKHDNMEESKQVLNRFINEKNALAVVYKGNFKVIGNIVFEQCHDKLDETFTCLEGRNLRFVLNPKYWGQNLMSEAMKCAIDYCFHELEFDFICSGYFLENDIQRSFNEKLGFKDYKTIIYHTNYGVDKKMGLTLQYNLFKK